jgi:hypothetical protein
MSISHVIYVAAKDRLDIKIFDLKKNVSQITTKTIDKKF